MNEQTYSAQLVVDAIRLALAGSEDDSTRVRLIESLVSDAPDTDGRDTESVRLFLDHVEALGGTVKVPA